MLKVSILTIGDEICIGQIVNTNSAWIATQCTMLGAEVVQHSAIGDSKEIMKAEIDRLSKFSDVLILTGGLGPTHDDITKPVLTEYFNDELVLHQPTLDSLYDYVNKRGIKLSERNRGMAILPSKCTALNNNVGTAPGMRFDLEGGKYLFSMPGVPDEMKSIMKEHILPFINDLIKTTGNDVVLYKTLQTTGVPESTLADLIGEPESFLNGGTLAYLPSYKGVRLRIGLSAKNFEEANEKLAKIETHIKQKAGDYIYSETDESLSEVVGKHLKDKGKTLSVAESCTGGMLGADITESTGSSSYFYGGAIVYSNEAKENILGVKKETLEQHGAVSEQTALELASRVREKFDTDYGISITGVAGPSGGTEEKPVGLVWIGLADSSGAIARKFIFGSERRMNRERSVTAALNMLYRQLLSNKQVGE